MNGGTWKNRLDDIAPGKAVRPAQAGEQRQGLSWQRGHPATAEGDAANIQGKGEAQSEVHRTGRRSDGTPGGIEGQTLWLLTPTNSGASSFRWRSTAKQNR